MVFSEEPNMSDAKAEFLKDYLHQDRRTAAVSCGTHHTLTEPCGSIHPRWVSTYTAGHQIVTVLLSCVCVYLHLSLLGPPAGGWREAVLKTG